MRNLILIIFFLSVNHVMGIGGPKSYYFGYYGETLTHTGFKAGMNFNLKDWEKTKSKKSNQDFTIRKSFVFTPSLGFYYHHNFHTGIFQMNEFQYIRRKPNGRFFGVGLGLGYLRTYVPKVYELDMDGNLSKVKVRYNYLLSGVSLLFGKEIKFLGYSADGIVKASLLDARPNYSNKMNFFTLEVGVNIRFCCMND